MRGVAGGVTNGVLGGVFKGVAKALASGLAKGLDRGVVPGVMKGVTKSPNPIALEVFLRLCKVAMIHTPLREWLDLMLSWQSHPPRLSHRR